MSADIGVLPSRAYAAGVARGDWRDDPAQQAALAELDRIHVALLDTPMRAGLLARMFGRATPAPRGLYLWGGVGRGKTFLIDLFYDGLPLPVADVTRYESAMLAFLRNDHAEVLGAIRDTRELGKDTESKLKGALDQFAKTFA